MWVKIKTVISVLCKNKVNAQWIQTRAKKKCFLTGYSRRVKIFSEAGAKTTLLSVSHKRKAWKFETKSIFEMKIKIWERGREIEEVKMSGARLRTLLGELGYEGAEKLDPDSFEWPFQYDDTRPVLDWICSSLRPSNVLSLSELSLSVPFLFLLFV